jgi:hypothetical protein
MRWSRPQARRPRRPIRPLAPLRMSQLR